MRSPAFPKHLAALSARMPLAALAVWAAACAASVAVILGFLRFDTGTTTFLDRSGDEWAAYRAAVSSFGGDEYIAVSLRGKGPFDWQLLEEVRPLTESIERLPSVRRVDSLASVALIRRGEEGVVETDAALANGIPETEADRVALADAINRDLIANRVLISEDRSSYGLAVMLDGDLDQDRTPLLDRLGRKLADMPATMTGVPVFRTEVNRRTQREVAAFVPFTLGLIAIVAYVSLGTLLSVFSVLVAGSAASLITVAALAVSGVPLSLSTMLLPSVLLALGCAYAMHMVVAARRRGAEDLLAALQRVAPGVAWSAVTTAIGFLAMATTEVQAIRELATYGALGALVAGCAALSLVPALLAIDRRARGGTGGRLEAMGNLADPLAGFAVRNQRPIIGCWILASLIIFLGATQLRVETNIINWFSRDDPIRTAYEEVRGDYAGITPISIVIRRGGGPEVTAPPVVAAVDELGRALEEMPSVGRVISVAEPLRMVGRAFGNEGLPSSQAEAEQFLLVLESEARIADLVTDRRDALNVMVRMDSNLSRDILAIKGWVDAWWASNGPSGFSVTTTGVMYEFARAQEAIAASQIRGLALAGLAVGAMLWIALGSMRRALLAVVPNALPIAVGFGVMGYLDVPVDAATVCLANLALGIAVDDTVHVALGVETVPNGSRAQRIADGLRPILPALVLTTICISLGFAILGLSSFVLVKNLGILTASVVATCLVADLTLLPALLARFGGDEA